jgi:hypothetical protein
MDLMGYQCRTGHVDLVIWQCEGDNSTICTWQTSEVDVDLANQQSGFNKERKVITWQQPFFWLYIAKKRNYKLKC